MHADKTMWNAISQYWKGTFCTLRSWYFGGEIPRVLTIPLFVFSLLVAFSIVAFIPGTMLGLYTMGGLFLLVLGVGPALVFLLVFAAVFYISLPCRLMSFLKSRVPSNMLCYLLTVFLMLVSWVGVGFLQVGYSYFIHCAGV